jgi:hypothetical protein
MSIETDDIVDRLFREFFARGVPGRGCEGAEPPGVQRGEAEGRTFDPLADRYAFWSEWLVKQGGLL